MQRMNAAVGDLPPDCQFAGHDVCLLRVLLNLVLHVVIVHGGKHRADSVVTPATTDKQQSLAVTDVCGCR